MQTRGVSSWHDDEVEHWRRDAACLGMDPSLFISTKIKPRGRRAEILEGVCRGCPVVIECRVYAVRLYLTDPIPPIGWWGGMNEEDRLNWARKEGML